MALSDLEGQWQNWLKFRAMYDFLTGKTLKMALCKGTVPTTPDGTLGLANIAEITAANYTAGGEALASVSITQDDSGNLGKFTANPVVWAALGAPSAGALTFVIIYVVGTVGGVVNPLLFVWANATQPNGQSYTINPNAAGYATLA